MSFQDSSQLSSSIDTGKSEHGMTKLPPTGSGKNGSEIFRYVSDSGCQAALPPLLNANSFVGLSSDTSGIQTVPRTPIPESSFHNGNVGQTRFGSYSVTGDFVRQPVGVLGSSAQHEFLGYDYDYPVVPTVPSQKFPIHNPVDELEACCVGQSFSQFSSVSGQFVKPAVTMQTVQPYLSQNPQNQPMVGGLEFCPSDVQIPVLTSAPLGLDYYSLDSCRLPPSVSCKTSLSVLDQTTSDSIRPSGPFESEEKCNPITTSINGVMRRTTPDYIPPSGLFPAHETSIGGVWDFGTPSSSVGSPSYDCSSVDLGCSSEVVSDPRMMPLASSSFSTPKILQREIFRDPSLKRAPGTKKLNAPKILPMNDQPTSQRVLGSSIDTHRLTAHVPRRRLTVEQEQTLLKRFAVQEYLSKREMEDLAEQLKIPTSQLRTWFGNRRNKLKAAARQRAKLEAGLGHLTDADLRSLHKRS